MKLKLIHKETKKEIEIEYEENEEFSKQTKDLFLRTSLGEKVCVAIKPDSLKNLRIIKNEI